MDGIYEELKGLLHHEKGAALATVVRGAEHVGAKLLVLPGKSTRGTLGLAALDALVVEDAERFIWNGDAGTAPIQLRAPPRPWYPQGAPLHLMSISRVFHLHRR